MLKLSKEDFELGFLQGRAAEGEAAEARRRARVLGFMQMVSPNQLLTLQRGDALYRRGDAVHDPAPTPPPSLRLHLP